MRWVFIRPLNLSPYYDPEVQEPLGLEYLAAVRTQKHDDVLILDCTIEALDEEKLAKRAVSFNPDIIGFSLTTGQEIHSVTLIYSYCRQFLANKKVLWVAGGNFVTSETIHSEKLLPKNFYLVKYAGEAILDDLVAMQATMDNASPGRVLLGKQITDLDSLPFPSRPYANEILLNNGTFNIQGSRGCCGSCRYCSAPGMINNQKKWNARSPKSIINEMVFLYQKYGVRSFNFIDEDFLGPPAFALDRAKAFKNELKKYPIKFSFGVQLRPNSLNEKIIKLLVKAGLAYVFMGIESDDPNDYKYWHRAYSKNMWEWVKLFQLYGVEINVGTILFHSGSTLDSLKRFALTLKNYQLLNYRTAVNRLDAMPGSFFYETGIKKGLFNSNAIGPQRIPFEESKVELFYSDLVKVLAPLGPPSMHAICSMPSLYTTSKTKYDLKKRLKKLKTIIQFLDAETSNAFFNLLSLHEKNIVNNKIVLTLQKKSLDYSIQGAEMLAKENFVQTFEQLRKAIFIDSGI
jgi:anaerobic magnesium-protoporphyrin IX monomethyl ester cyclase